VCVSESVCVRVDAVRELLWSLLVCTCVYVRVCMCRCALLHAFVRVCDCLCVRMCMRMSVCVCECKHTKGGPWAPLVWGEC